MNGQHFILAKMVRILTLLKMGTMLFGDRLKSICLVQSIIASLILLICVTSISLMETITVSMMEVLVNEIQHHQSSPSWSLSVRSNLEHQPVLPETKSIQLLVLPSSPTPMSTASKSRCSERAFRRVKNLKGSCISKYFLQSR